MFLIVASHHVCTPPRKSGIESGATLNWNRRIRALKRGEDPKPPLHKRSTSPQEARSDSVDLSASRLATHVHTIYNDPIEHAITPISAILTNGTIPNKFRVQARVKSVHPRGSAGSDSLVQQHCMKCSRE